MKDFLRALGRASELVTYCPQGPPKSAKYRVLVELLYSREQLQTDPPTNEIGDVWIVCINGDRTEYTYSKEEGIEAYNRWVEYYEGIKNHHVVLMSKEIKQ